MSHCLKTNAPFVTFTFISASVLAFFRFNFTRFFVLSKDPLASSLFQYELPYKYLADISPSNRSCVFLCLVPILIQKNHEHGGIVQKIKIYEYIIIVILSGHHFHKICIYVCICNNFLNRE